jgi:hypothetical protein
MVFRPSIHFTFALHPSPLNTESKTTPPINSLTNKQHCNMEDRHSISEPRPIHGKNYAEWEIDILRDDTVIVDTFIINNEVLPPRTNKKGKVLWRLPDTVDKLVSIVID